MRRPSVRPFTRERDILSRGIPNAVEIVISAEILKLSEIRPMSFPTLIGSDADAIRAALKLFDVGFAVFAAV